MVNQALWWIAAALAFLGMLLVAAGSAYGREWPARLLDFCGMVTLAWGVAGAAICGIIELVAWWLP